MSQGLLDMPMDIWLYYYLSSSSCMVSLLFLGRAQPPLYLQSRPQHQQQVLVQHRESGEDLLVRKLTLEVVTRSMVNLMHVANCYAYYILSLLPYQETS